MSKTDEGLLDTLATAAMFANVSKGANSPFWTTLFLTMHKNKSKGRDATKGMTQKQQKAVKKIGSGRLKKLANKAFAKGKFKEHVLSKLKDRGIVPVVE